MHLNDNQRQALESGQPVPIVVDQTPCVVVRQDVYERIEQSLELTHDDLRRAVARSFESSGWNSPEMDVYDNYDAHRNETR